MLFPRTVLPFAIVLVLIPLGYLKAQDAGPSMQDTINYLVEHISTKAGGQWTAWAFNRSQGIRDNTTQEHHYKCLPITDGICIKYTPQFFDGRKMQYPPGWTLNLYFASILPNRSVVTLGNRYLDNPRYDLTIHYKSTLRADDYITIFLTDEAEAQRVLRALEHAAKLGGATPDPFDQ